MAESTISIPWDVTKPEGSKFYIKYDPAKTSQQVSFTSDENRAAARSRTITFVTVAPGLSTESQKRIEVTVNQAAGVVTYSYSLTVSKTTAAAAGETLTLTPKVQKIINGTNEGSPYTVDGVTYKVERGTVSGNSWAIPENQSTDKLTGLKVTATFPSTVGGGTASATIEQEAGVKTYSTPSVSLSYDDIPAGGGTVSPKLSYSQTWGWNGKTTGGGTITTGGIVSYINASNITDGSVTAPSKGTMVSARSSVKTGVAASVTLNGKTGSSAAVTVYQAANAITSTTYGTPVVKITSPTSGTVSALGTTSGDLIIKYTATESVTYTYTSGSESTTSQNIGNNPTVGFDQDWGEITEYSEGADYTGVQLMVDENTSTSSRSGVLTVEVTGSSGKTGSGSLTITQSAATITYNVRLTGSTTTAAAGGAVITIYPQKQEVINGKAGSWVNNNTGVTLSTTLGSIINTTQLSIQENQSTSSRTITVTGNFSNEGKTATLVITQSAGVKTYSTPTVTLSYDDIPAGGGTVKPKLSYSQTWGWNGKTTGGGTITTGASVSYISNPQQSSSDGSVTASSKGTRVSARSTVAGVSVAVTLNGKTGTSDVVTVYQAANAITSTTDGTPVISLSTSATTIAATGGTITVTSSVSIPTTNHYTSGSTAAGTPRSDTPTVTVSGTGFSYANGKVTVAENTTTSTRTGTVRATYTGAITKTVTITQSAGQAIILSVDETTLGWKDTVFTLYSEIHLGSYTTEDVFERRNGYSYKFITSGPIYHNEDLGYSGSKHEDEFALDDYNYSLTNDDQFSVTLEVYQYGGSPVASSTIHLTRKHSPGFLVLKTSQNKIISWESGINNDYINITDEIFHFVTSSNDNDFVAGTFVLSSCDDGNLDDKYLLDHVNTYQYSGYLAALPGATLGDPAFRITGHESGGAVVGYHGRFFDSEEIQITLNFSF